MRRFIVSPSQLLKFQRFNRHLRQRQTNASVVAAPHANMRKVPGSGDVGGGGPQSGEFCPDRHPPGSSVNDSEGMVPTEFCDAEDGPEFSSQ